MDALVSVLMSVHNEESWVEQAAKSILAQDYTRFKLVIIDDGSTDKTPTILKRLAKDRRVKVIRQRNNGLTKALNNGLKHCTGTYIARMDADNIALPTRIREQVAFLKQHPDHALVGTWREERYPDGTRRVRKFPVTNAALQRGLVRACMISHSSVMIRADILKKYKYDEQYRTSQDYELWTRIGKGHKLANLSKVLTIAYQRPGSITRRKKKWETLKTKLKIHWQAYKNLDCPWWSLIWLLKPFVEVIIPRNILRVFA